ncbi:MAG TPA: DNA polymerase III subunit delta [Nitrospira sp.]|jgi:DNA polymerase-3 subunit delta|nr:DNA polymerase III subunit delta [Nitrospira sp.]
MAPPISVAQLAAQLKNDVLRPLYAVIGEEDLLRDAALALVKEAALGTDSADFNCDLFYGDEADGTAIVACASEVAVFAPRRLVIVKAADKLSAKHTEALLPYLKAPNESTTLVFAAQKLDGRLKFTQALGQASVAVDCSPPKDSQLLPWLRQEANRLGIRFDDEALYLLREACGGSLYAVRHEMEKLASYVPAGRSVSAGDVAALRGTQPGASVFDLAAAIGGRRRGTALAILARNLEAGEAPLRILGSLAWQYRRLWKVKDLLRQAGHEGEAARQLRMDPSQVRPFLGQFAEAHLRDAVRRFLVTDSRLKGGSGGRPEMLLDRLILELCDRPPGDGRRPQETSGAVSRSKTLSNVRTISGTPTKNSRPG